MKYTYDRSGYRVTSSEAQLPDALLDKLFIRNVFRFLLPLTSTYKILLSGNAKLFSDETLMGLVTRDKACAYGTRLVTEDDQVYQYVYLVEKHPLTSYYIESHCDKNIRKDAVLHIDRGISIHVKTHVVRCDMCGRSPMCQIKSGRLFCHISTCENSAVTITPLDLILDEPKQPPQSKKNNKFIRI